MAGTVTQSSRFANLHPGNSLPNRIVIPWLTSAGGAADLTDIFIEGTVTRVLFVPDAGGTQPSNAYDVVITDEYAVDILSGQGANLSNAAPVEVCPGIPLKDGTTVGVVPRTTIGLHTLALTNGGNAKGGKVIIFFR